jgi:hypothetical protein
MISLSLVVTNPHFSVSVSVITAVTYNATCNFAVISCVSHCKLA